MMDSADPLAGWSLSDVISKGSLAKHDIYGSLFFYLQEILLHFCHQLQTLEIHFHLYHADAIELPRIINTGGFDRIEVILQPTQMVADD